MNGDWFDDVYPAPSRPQVREWLAGALAEAEAAYIPFGIHHPDHLLTSNLLLDLIRTEPVLPEKLLPYDELPYRVNYPELANGRFTHIENVIGRLRLIEQHSPNEPKERAVRQYASQVDEPLIEKLLVRERVWELVR